MWTLDPDHLSNGTLAAPVVVLPDLDGDGVRDLVVLAIGELQVWSLLPEVFNFLRGLLQLLRSLPRTLFLQWFRLK